MKLVASDFCVTNLDLSDSDDVAPAELAVAQLTENISVITVSCELDMVTSPALGQLLTQELDNGHRAVLVDLCQCGFMGSSGLAVLIGAREHATRTGARIVLSGLTPTVTRSLQVTDLETVSTIYPTTQDALTDLTGET
jgi:anti-sigma B factor antagonist